MHLSKAVDFELRKYSGARIAEDDGDVIEEVTKFIYLGDVIAVAVEERKKLLVNE